MIYLLVGLLIGGASVWLPWAAVDPLARLLVPAIALLATSIFPCMSLAVGSLKAEQRGPSQVDELYVQLRTIMQILVVSFALAVFAVASIAGLAAIVSNLPSEPVVFARPVTAKMVAVAASRALLFLVSVNLALLAGRVVAVGKAFFAILEINRKHAMLVARAKVQGDRDKAMGALKRGRPSRDYGEPQDLERVG